MEKSTSFSICLFYLDFLAFPSEHEFHFAVSDRVPSCAAPIIITMLPLHTETDIFSCLPEIRGKNLMTFGFVFLCFLRSGRQV